MKKAFAVALAVWSVICVLALMQPHWNPFTLIILIAMAIASLIYAYKFWHADQKGE